MDSRNPHASQSRRGLGATLRWCALLLLVVGYFAIRIWAH